MNLVLGYNGFARVLGRNHADFGPGAIRSATPRATARSPRRLRRVRRADAGLSRLFSGEFGFEIGWLLPAALLALVLVLVVARPGTAHRPGSGGRHPVRRLAAGRRTGAELHEGHGPPVLLPVGGARGGRRWSRSAAARCGRAANPVSAESACRTARGHRRLELVAARPQRRLAAGAAVDDPGRAPRSPRVGSRRCSAPRRRRRRTVAARRVSAWRQRWPGRPPTRSPRSASPIRAAVRPSGPHVASLRSSAAVGQPPTTRSWTTMLRGDPDAVVGRDGRLVGGRRPRTVHRHRGDGDRRVLRQRSGADPGPVQGRRLRRPGGVLRRPAGLARQAGRVAREPQPHRHHRLGDAQHSRAPRSATPTSTT